MLMNNIRIEVLSPLAEKLETQFKGETARLEREVAEGTTVRDILNQFSREYGRFTEAVFDVKAQKQTESANIYLNGRILEMADGLATRLKDGDTLTFVTIIAGG